MRLCSSVSFGVSLVIVGDFDSRYSVVSIVGCSLSDFIRFPICRIVLLMCMARLVKLDFRRGERSAMICLTCLSIFVSVIPWVVWLTNVWVRSLFWSRVMTIRGSWCSCWLASRGFVVTCNNRLMPGLRAFSGLDR